VLYRHGPWRSFAKFQDTIYFYRGSEVFVNQFIASTLDWKSEEISFSKARVSRANKEPR